MLAFSLLVVSVDNTILNVALPTIREELDASSSQLQWIVDSYLLVFAGLLLAAGSLGDRFGRKRALFVGLGIFGAGSLLAAISSSSTELIASRALMGVGAAAIMPTTLSIITNIFPKDERPKAIAVWAAVAGMGIAIGPISGGWLIEHFAWSSIFLVNLPIVLGCLIAGAVLIPESRDPESPRLDFPGIGLSDLGPDGDRLGPHRGARAGLDQHDDPGGVRDGRGDPGGIHCLGAAREAADARRDRVPQPALQRGKHLDHLRVLRADGRHVLPHHLLAVGDGLQRAQAGVRMVPIAIGLILASRLSVALTARLGTKVVVAGGLAVVAFALGAFTAVTSTPTITGRSSAALSMMGVGMGLAMAPATDAIMGSLPKAKAGIGSAMNDVVRELGGTLGVAVLGSIVSTSYASGIDGATSGLPPALPKRRATAWAGPTRSPRRWVAARRPSWSRPPTSRSSTR